MMRTNLQRWMMVVLLLSLISLGQNQVTQAKQELNNSDVILIDWNSDGSRVATSSFDGIRVYDANFQFIGFFPNPLDPRYDADYQAFGAFWSPDGTRLTAGAMILDAKTFQPIITTKAYHSLAQWSPDGKYVSTVAIDYKSIERYDAQTGKIEGKISFDGLQLIGLPFLTPDGKRYVLNLGDTIGVADATGKYLARYKYPYAVNILSLSPDGTKVAYQSTENVPVSTPGSFPNPGNTGRGTLVHAFIIDAATGKTLIQSEPLSSFLAEFQWSPDGTQLSGNLASKSIITWDTVTGKVIDTYTLPSGKGITTFAYDPFGGRIVLAMRDFPSSDATVINLTGMPASNFNQTFLDGKIQIIVPAASTQKLQSILQGCEVNSNVEQALIEQINGDKLQRFMDEVKAVTDEDIPTGCKGDLLAVAEALMAKTK